MVLVRWIRRVVVAGLIGVGAGAAPLAAQFESGIPVGTKAPVLVINDLDGKPVDLGAYIGKKPVLIEFWATWCSSCKSLLPELAKVRKTFGDGVALIGINVTVNESRDRVRRYLKAVDPGFLVLYDESGASTRAYDVPGTSYVVVIDAGGTVRYTGTGGDQDLVAAVRKAVR